jgi:hypothetical protein
MHPGDPEGTKRSAWKRARDELQRTERIGVNGDLVWINGD